MAFNTSNDDKPIIKMTKSHLPSQRCQHSIFKMLNDFEIQSEKCLIYDEMVKNFPIFCLISPISFAYIKQKWKLQELKWVMIKQNE